MAAMMGGTSPAAFMDIPALLIIIGGTGGVTMASCGMDSDEEDPRAVQARVRAAPTRPQRPGPAARRLRRAGPARGPAGARRPDRRDRGRLHQKGLQLVVDGSDPELVREVLEAEIDGMAARHPRARGRSRRPAASRRRWASSAPSWAWCTCSRTCPRPATLGPAISSAFIATLMGVGSANVIYLPIANRLKALSARRGRAANADPGGHPGRPGRRQPARRGREAGSFVPPAERGADDEGGDGHRDAASRGGLPDGGVMADRQGQDAGHAVEHENEERWLLTYADMLTLMFALFMVLYSISSVNISKYEILQQSLKAAFSGSILSGGQADHAVGLGVDRRPHPGHRRGPVDRPADAQPMRSQARSQRLPAQAASSRSPRRAAGGADQRARRSPSRTSFVRLQHKLESYAKAHGFANQVRRSIDRSGLVVHVLTDKLLFDSGSGHAAAGRPAAARTRSRNLLNVDRSHPITVEGYTDNQPIHSAQFPSNWELSTDRATTVVRYLIGRGVNDQPAGGGRLRRPAPAGQQRHRGRAGAQPPRRHRARRASEPRPRTPRHRDPTNEEEADHHPARRPARRRLRRQDHADAKPSGRQAEDRRRDLHPAQGLHAATSPTGTTRR